MPSIHLLSHRTSHAKAGWLQGTHQPHARNTDGAGQARPLDGQDPPVHCGRGCELSSRFLPTPMFSLVKVSHFVVLAAIFVKTRWALPESGPFGGNPGMLGPWNMAAAIFSAAPAAELRPAGQRPRIGEPRMKLGAPQKGGGLPRLFGYQKNQNWLAAWSALCCLLPLVLFLNKLVSATRPWAGTSGPPQVLLWCHGLLVPLARGVPGSPDLTASRTKILFLKAP